MLDEEAEKFTTGKKEAKRTTVDNDKSSPEKTQPDRWSCSSTAEICHVAIPPQVCYDGESRQW